MSMKTKNDGKSTAEIKQKLSFRNHLSLFHLNDYDMTNSI